MSTVAPLSSIEKTELIHQVISHLQKELDVMLSVAKTAHEAATHEQARSEDKHDTRGIEAGYLAGAQAARAEELQRIIQALRDFRLPKSETSLVQLGSLVEVESEDRSSLYFLIPEGAAGITIESHGRRIQIITSRSPIGDALLGRNEGDAIEIETSRKTLELEILAIQ